MKGGSTTSAGGRTRAALVIVEVALSVLLVSASLTIAASSRSKSRSRIPTEQVMGVGFPLPPKRYPTETAHDVGAGQKHPWCHSRNDWQRGLPLAGPNPSTRLMVRLIRKFAGLP
jgi:hypothetical protein